MHARRGPRARPAILRRGSVVATALAAVAALAVSVALAHAAGVATWTTLTSSSNPVLVGQPVTFAATVKPVGGGATPTGTVTFKDAAAPIGTGTLDDAGRATFTTAALGLGTHPITGVYGGDGSFSPSTSDVLQQAVPQSTSCTAGFFQAPGSPVPAGSGPNSVAVSDFNLDGKSDLAVANRRSDDVTILLGDGSGGFSLRAGTPVSVGQNPNSVAVGDFDLDGKPDLAVAGAMDVTILLGDGNGAFNQPAGSPISVSGWGENVAAAVGDLNLDGTPDLAVLNWGKVTLLLGTGSGGFSQPAGSPVILAWSGDGAELAVADFNLDGKPDLAVLAIQRIPWSGPGLPPPPLYSQVTVLLGDGTGVFSPEVGFGLGVWLTTSMAAGDLNLDGKPDLAVGLTDLYGNSVKTLLGDGSGGFTSKDSNSTSMWGGIVVGDFNLDGRPDLALTRSWNNETRILLGDGTGVFSPAASPVAEGRAPRSPAAGDFNLDGQPDLAVANGDSDNVTIFLNNCGAPPSLTTVSSSPNPSAFGQEVTLTATVSAASGTGTPTGLVQFRDGVTYLGAPVSLVGGTATLTTLTLGEGAHALTAVYSGNADFAGSTSSPSSHTVLSRLTINDPIGNAGEGPTTLDFTVWLSTPSALAVTVDYATTDHTAKAGTDYTATSGTLIFNPGETTRTVGVPILGQSLPGPAKDFFLALTNPTNATLAKGAGIGTIVYSLPGSLTLYIDDPSLHEGNAGTTLLGFTLSLSKAIPGSVTVNYATADGTAQAGVDYTARSGTVTFSPGQTSRSVLVPVQGNTTMGADKTLFVNLTDASTSESAGIALAKSQGTGTILDDDPPAAAASVAQYRLYSPITYEHLYTTDTNEYAVLATRGWLQEGAAYTMFQDGGAHGGVYGVPLYRLYHLGVRQHHWTTDWHEVTVLAAGAWDYEGIPGYVLPTAVAGTVPLYRLALAYPPLHLWTTDANEYQVLTTPERGWIGEGVIGYVLP